MRLALTRAAKVHREPSLEDKRGPDSGMWGRLHSACLLGAKRMAARRKTLKEKTRAPAKKKRATPPKRKSKKAPAKKRSKKTKRASKRKAPLKKTKKKSKKKASAKTKKKASKRTAAKKKKATKKQVAKKAKPKKKVVAKKATKKKTKKSKSVLPRLRIVWAVCDHIRKIIKMYHYTERGLAEAHAERLSKSKKKEHVVRPHKVPMED